MNLIFIFICGEPVVSFFSPVSSSKVKIFDLIDKLKKTNDGDGSLLDHSLVLYGSPMGDSNLHNHKRVPMILLGKANGLLKGNNHVLAEDGTPAANMYLTLLHKLGIEAATFGDSTGEMEL